MPKFALNTNQKGGSKHTIWVSFAPFGLVFYRRTQGKPLPKGKPMLGHSPLLVTAPKGDRLIFLAPLANRVSDLQVCPYPTKLCVGLLVLVRQSKANPTKPNHHGGCQQKKMYVRNKGSPVSFHGVRSVYSQIFRASTIPTKKTRSPKSAVLPFLGGRVPLLK